MKRSLPFEPVLSVFAGVCLFAVAPLDAADSSQRQETRKPRPSLGTIERLDATFNTLIPEEGRIELLAEGFEWAEGPVWNRREAYLLFSDIPRNVVFKWQDGQSTSVYLEPSGYTGRTPRGGELGSNGLLYDSQGRLVLCQHGDRRVARLAPEGRFETVVSYYKWRRFNSPNDAVYKSNGDLYFTDPPYGLLKRNDDPAKELIFNGVFRLSKEGQLTLLTGGMTYPNGIAFSPDESTLYVANSDPKQAVWMSFPVLQDGTLGEGKVFFDATKWVGEKPGLPDGLKVDIQGNLFATGPGGVLILSPEGRHLGTLNTGVATANCAWGNDGSMLYITADRYLCRVQTRTLGLGFQRK